MVKGPDQEEARQRLALIQRLWDELKAERHDPEKYNALMTETRLSACCIRSREGLRCAAADEYWMKM
jgi:hypothetical protein